MANHNKPQFDKRIFWDIDFAQLDYDKNASFIIERIFNRGDVQDIRECRRFYGDDAIQHVLLNARFISTPRLHLASAVLDQPLSAFKCYILKQSNPSYYPY